MERKRGEKKNKKKKRIIKKKKKNRQKIWHNWEFGKLKVRKIWIGKIGKLEKKLKTLTDWKLHKLRICI